MYEEDETVEHIMCILPALFQSGCKYLGHLPDAHTIGYPKYNLRIVLSRVVGTLQHGGRHASLAAVLYVVH